MGYPADAAERHTLEWQQYDKRYEQAAKRPYFYHFPRDRHFINALMKYCNIQPGSRLIDLGCGQGRYAALWRDRGMKVTGVDLSPKGIEHAKKTFGAGVEWLCEDVLKVGRPQTYDFAFAYYLTWFGMFDRPQDAQEGVRIMMSYLKPGGKFIWSWHTDFSSVRFSSERFSVFNFTLAQVREMFAGFEPEIFATDSEGRAFSILGKHALNRWVTKLSCGWTAFKNSSWDRSRLIVIAKA